MALERAGDRISKGYQFGITVMNLARRWVFLLGLAYCVPVLVVFRGGDALSVCFNAVAIVRLHSLVNNVSTFIMFQRAVAFLFSTVSYTRMGLTECITMSMLL
jgi:hypothetical protein